MLERILFGDALYIFIFLKHALTVYDPKLPPETEPC